MNENKGVHSNVNKCYKLAKEGFLGSNKSP